MPTRQTAGRLTLIVVSILVVVQASAQDVSVAALRAAEQGDAAAQFNLGRMYESIDLAEAAKWYRLAAEQGHAGAQSELCRIRPVVPPRCRAGARRGAGRRRLGVL